VHTFSALARAIFTLALAVLHAQNLIEVIP